MKHDRCISVNNLYICSTCLPLNWPIRAALIQLRHLICKILSVGLVISGLYVLYVPVHVKPSDMLIDRGSQALSRVLSRAYCVKGFWASWLLRTGYGARLCGSAKKVSEPTSATCSSPSESRLPIWEVRGRDTGQFQESTVAISTETEAV